MHIATIKKNSETNYQPIVLFDHMTGPVIMDSHPSKYKAKKYIDQVTNGNRKLVRLNKLYEEHQNRIHESYMRSKQQWRKQETGEPKYIEIDGNNLNSPNRGT